MNITVVIPVFNSIKTLNRAVNSALIQGQVDEIILVEDGSTDGSYELANDLVRKFDNIKLLTHPQRVNKGPCASRNLGLTNATNQWIQFLDADDELINGKLTGQLKIVDPEVSFVVGNSIHILPDGKRHSRKSDHGIWKGLIRSKLGDTCANLWNKKYLKEVGGWNETLGSSQEYDLMFRLVCLHPKIVFDNRYLTFIHQTVNSISTHPQKKEERFKNWLWLRYRIRTHLIRNKEFGIKNQYHWSGAVGVFCDLNLVKYPSEINQFLLRIYKLEIGIKQSLHHIIYKQKIKRLLRTVLFTSNIGI